MHFFLQGKIIFYFAKRMLKSNFYFKGGKYADLVQKVLNNSDYFLARKNVFLSCQSKVSISIPAELVLFIQLGNPIENQDFKYTLKTLTPRIRFEYWIVKQ